MPIVSLRKGWNSRGMEKKPSPYARDIMKIGLIQLPSVKWKGLVKALIFLRERKNEKGRCLSAFLVVPILNFRVSLSVSFGTNITWKDMIVHLVRRLLCFPMCRDICHCLIGCSDDYVMGACCFSFHPLYHEAVHWQVWFVCMFCLREGSSSTVGWFSFNGHCESPSTVNRVLKKILSFLQNTTKFALHFLSSFQGFHHCFSSSSSAFLDRFLLHSSLSILFFVVGIFKL